MLATFFGSDAAELLQDIEAALEAEGFITAGAQGQLSIKLLDIMQSGGGGGDKGSRKTAFFFDLVFIPLLDENKDGLVTQRELAQLQLRGEYFAEVKQAEPPQDWVQLISVIFMGFERKALRGPSGGGTAAAFWVRLENIAVVLQVSSLPHC